MAAATLLVVVLTPALGAQELADFDYENLAFRGIGVEGGYIFPNNVEETYTVGFRMDLGYLGPGFRIVPGLSYWSSNLVRSEVGKLEERVADLVVRESGAPRPRVDLGVIEWSDVVVRLDGHFVWSIAGGLLSYAGAGGAAHLMNGQGPSVDGTFVEDLLDSVRAGFNLHGGLEWPVHERFRLYSSARLEVLGDLQYGELRLGAQLHTGGAETGEGPGR